MNPHPTHPTPPQDNREAVWFSDLKYKALPNRRPTGHAQHAQQAIRERCLQCVEGPSDVERCTAGPNQTGDYDPCSLWPHRLPPQRNERATEGDRLKAIRSYCLWCVCGSAHEVKLCPSTPCALWPFRFGVRPQTAEKRGLNVSEAKSPFDNWSGSLKGGV